MCGIAGIYGLNNTLPEQNLFRRLLMLNVDRGHHSTGVLKIERKGNKDILRTQRSLEPSPMWMWSKQGMEFLDSKDSKPLLLLGHTRHATKGEVNLKNCHPFGFENVIGIHNGTIEKAFQGSAQYGTDSEALYALINDVGIEEALKEISDKSPAYVLVFVDKKKNTLNFIRNDRRTLFFTFLFGRTTLAWSSTKEDLEHAITKGKLTPGGWETGDTNKYFYLKPNQLMSIKIGESASSAHIEELDIPTPTFPISRTYSYPNYGAGYGAYYEDSDKWWEEYDRREAEKKKRRKEASKRKEKHPDTANKLSNIPWLDQPARRNRDADKPVSENEERFRLGCGCFSCGVVIDYDDIEERERVKWWNREYYACGDCYENTTGDTDWVRRTVDDDWADEDKKKVVH